MNKIEALDVLCRSGAFSAGALNTLHACRPNHPWNKPTQWRNAAFILAGRPLRGEEWEARRVIEAAANEEARAQA